MNDLCSRCGRAYDHEAGSHACLRTQRRVRNAPYAVPDAIAEAAIEAAYMEFCRVLGNWNPEFPGQRDALKAALLHSWEISTNLIEAAVLRALVDELEQRALAHSEAAVHQPDGSKERTIAASFLVATQQIIEMISDLVSDRDAFRLIEIGGAEDA